MALGEGDGYTEEDLWTKVGPATWVYAGRFAVRSALGRAHTTEVVLVKETAMGGYWALDERTIPPNVRTSPIERERKANSTVVDRIAETEWSEMSTAEAFAWALTELRAAAYARIEHMLETTKHLNRHIEGPRP